MPPYFEKFSTFNSNMQRNDINIIVVNDKAKAFVGMLGLWVRKLEGKSWDMFSVGRILYGKTVETSDSGIEQCIKVYLVRMHSRFS
jgi:hypothetical protein